MLNPHPEYHLMHRYGSDVIELLIYDFSIEPGEEFQVGEDEYYTDEFIFADEEGRNEILCSMLYETDRGRIKCLSTENVFDGETSVKQLELCLTHHNNHPSGFDDTCTIQEGVGFLKWKNKEWTGFMPYPYNRGANLYMPGPRYDTLYVCDVEDINDIKEGNFGKVVYRREGMPENPKEYFDTLAVDEIRADEDVIPMYFNIQGMPVSNPTEGEIYIVRRGSKATKEVFRR